MAAETQVQNISIYITGIDMSSVFNTIYRDEPLKIVEGFLDKDDLRVLSTALVETTLESKVENAQTTTFESNIGSPQGNSISGPLFTLYFNRALHQIKNEMQRHESKIGWKDGKQHLRGNSVCWWLCLSRRN